MDYKKEIKEEEYLRLSKTLPGSKGGIGRPGEDNRRFLEAVAWICKNGGRWRSLPPVYGKWSSVHKRFKRWADKGIWHQIFQSLSKDADLEWIMIDSTIVRAHQHSAGGKKKKLIKL